MSDAPTTLPTEAMPSSSWWLRIGSMVSSPLRGFRALVDDKRAHPLEPLLLYALATAAVAAPEIYRLLALANTAPAIAARRIGDVLLHASRTDVAVVAGAAAVVGGLAHAFSDSSERGVRRFVGGAIATSYLLVGLAVMKALGGLLSIAGAELWFLPHRAVDSFAVVVNQRIDWGRFALKCVVSYGPGIAVLIAWLATVKKPATPPRAFDARAGLALVVFVVFAEGAAAVVDVAARSTALRPHLAGDMFLSVPLKKLDGDTNRKGSRADIITMATTPGTKAVVVDFWASWCAPCRRSLPELSKLNTELQERGLVVIGVNREPSDLPAARKAWAEIAPSFRSLVDDKGLGDKLGLTSLPSTYILDGKGVIRFVHLGYTEPALIRSEVESLLR